MTETRIAASSDSRPAQCDLSFRPPSNRNSVASGIIATSALRNSESPTGSSTCLYITPPPVLEAELPTRTRPGTVSGSGARDANYLDERVQRIHLAAIQLLRDTR